MLSSRLLMQLEPSETVAAIPEVIGGSYAARARMRLFPGSFPTGAPSVTT